MTSMNKVFADLPVTIFEAMSQARARQQRHQSRPGFSRRSRTGGYPEGGRRRVGERLQPVPLDDGDSGIAPGDRGALRPLARPEPRSDDRGDGDLRRHRGADLGDPGRGRAGRRSHRVPAGLRFLSADHPPGRRHSAPAAARTAALAAERGDAEERLQPQDQGGAVQQSAQSGRRGLSARGSRTAGAVLPGVRHASRSATRSGSTSSSTAASIFR